jgi:hypothetical protein
MSLFDPIQRMLDVFAQQIDMAHFAAGLAFSFSI